MTWSSSVPAATDTALRINVSAIGDDTAILASGDSSPRPRTLRPRHNGSLTGPPAGSFGSRSSPQRSHLLCGLCLAHLKAH